MDATQIYNVAADYRLWVLDEEPMYATNVQGTLNVLAAARRHRVGRVIHTSTVGALGVVKGAHGTEDTPVTLGDMVGPYKRSKFLAEQAALAAAREGLPVVVVNPSTPIGPLDYKPTPTGRIIVDFLNGRMPAYLDTGLNLVDVGHCAQGHLLAAEGGRAGAEIHFGRREPDPAGVVRAARVDFGRTGAARQNPLRRRAGIRDWMPISYRAGSPGARRAPA